MEAHKSAFFPFLILNSLFWQIWSKKVKIVSVSINLVPRLILNMESSIALFTFSVLGRQQPFWTNFCTYTNSNMNNSVVFFTFSVLYWKHLFWKTKVNKMILLFLRPYGSRDFEIGNRLWNSDHSENQQPIVSLSYNAVNKMACSLKWAFDRSCWSYFYKCYITLDITIFSNSLSAEKDHECQMNVRSCCAKYYLPSDKKTTCYLK